MIKQARTVKGTASPSSQSPSYQSSSWMTRGQTRQAKAQAPKARATNTSWMTEHQGCGSATRFRCCRTKKKIKKLALTWSRGGPSLPPIQNPAKHKICVLSITRNVGPRTGFEYGFFLSAYAPPFFSCPTAWPRNLTLLWHWSCPARGQSEPFLAVRAPAEQRLLHFRLRLPISQTLGHGSRISCVTPVGSQDEAVREAFPWILRHWP